MNEGAHGSAVSLERAPSPSFAPPAFLRLAAIAGRTAWLAGSLLRTRNPHEALQRWCRDVLEPLGIRIELHGPLDRRPLLWVSNHLSWLDPVILLSLRPMGALAKGELARYPVIGRASRRLGLAFVNRADATSRAAAVARLVAELRRGNPLLLFPEGTTTPGDALAPLQEGGLRAAFRCGTAVQTLRLSSRDPVYPWVGDDALIPHLLRLVRSPATWARVEAGKVLEPCQFPDEEAWIEAIRHQLTPRGSFER